MPGSPTAVVGSVADFRLGLLRGGIKHECSSKCRDRYEQTGSNRNRGVARPRGADTTGEGLGVGPWASLARLVGTARINDMKPRIILAGGSGFLGQALASYFQKLGFEILILTRSAGQTGGRAREVTWDACTIGPWQQELESATAVVNLTGRSVNCRYNARNRKEILDSRLNST